MKINTGSKLGTLKALHFLKYDGLITAKLVTDLVST